MNDRYIYRTRQEERFIRYFNKLPSGKMLSINKLNKLLNISICPLSNYMKSLEKEGKIIVYRPDKRNTLWIKI